MQPHITVVGNVATQPQQREPRPGLYLTQFRLAQNQRKRDNFGNWVDGPTSWYDVTCWRGQSHNVYKSVNKGDPVIVFGRLRINDWEKEGRTGRDVLIDAIAVGPDLRWGTASFAKVKRAQQDQADDSDDHMLELSRMADAEMVAERLGANGEPPDGFAGDPGFRDSEPDRGPFGGSDTEKQAA